MPNLIQIEIIAMQELEDWTSALREDGDSMQARIREWFAGRDRWVYPDVKVTQKDTGMEMNRSNLDEMTATFARERQERAQRYLSGSGDFVSSRGRGSRGRGALRGRNDGSGAMTF